MCSLKMLLFYMLRNVNYLQDLLMKVKDLHFTL